MEKGSMSEFFQDGPVLKNTFLGNRWLKPYLRTKFPKDIWGEVESDLQRLGGDAAGPYLALGRQAEREKPVHIPFDPWGQRIDEIRVSSAWTELERVAAREGLVAIGYHRQQGEYSRLYQFAKLFLFHPSSAFFTCPLAMADGAAKVMETYGAEESHRLAFQHLTSRDPKEFWTSGQWMTERAGGSDVSETGTRVEFENGKARLYGTKWFSSATTSAMALALARCPNSPAGSRGLTLFQVQTYASPGRLNGIRVLRLKDKMGTWALPTAELSLEGAYATQVGELDQGVKTVASMLNITRLYNSVCSIGQTARGLELMRDYSDRRRTFGQKLSDHVLHYSNFVDEELKALAGFLLTFELVHLLGREECKTGNAGEGDILRLMTPVCKLFTAKVAIHGASEVIEGFGGAGYIEDTGMPSLLRDAQVFPIWEGATNVLSLDMMRVLQKTDALETLKEDILKRLEQLGDADLKIKAQNLKVQLGKFESSLTEWLKLAPEVQLASSRSLAFYLGRLYSYVLLLSWASRADEPLRQNLKPWVEQFAESFLGTWTLVGSEECQRRRKLWQQNEGF
jgi:alkylation response protein AidB-like acyl-CoA dehydrogenase